MELVNVTVVVRYPNGSEQSCSIVGRECVLDDGNDGIQVTAKLQDSKVVEACSGKGFFDAIRHIRKTLEQEGIMLWCFASDEAVYPSPMQEAMGLNTLAYRNKLGQQARTADIVDIFRWDDSITVVSVDQQDAFHRRWLESL
jgi:hypothetical protein